MLLVYRFFCPLSLVWLLVCSLYKKDYLQILNVCHIDYTAVVGNGKVWRVNRLTTTVWWL